MTVTELIETLKTMPPDATVIYQWRSEHAELRADEIEVCLAEDRKIVWRAAWQDGYSRYYPKYWPKDETPEFRTVVIFPGN